jgi:hypothetical protein
MMRTILLLMLGGALCNAQVRLQMPMQGAPLPQTKFELVNKIPAIKLTHLPKEMPVFRWSQHPRDFPVTAMQKLVDQTVFAGTNVASLLSITNRNDGIKLSSADNQDSLVITPSAGRIAIVNIERSREYPPPDAVPDFDAIWQQALRLAETFGVGTNEMERSPDGSIHIRKTENTTSHLGGTVKYKSKRSVTAFRSIAGYLVRSQDEDKIELEVGVNGQLLKFDFKWPNIEASRTNQVFTISAIMDEIKQGQVLGDMLNEYPSGGIAQIELTDFQVFYYVSTMFPYNRRSPSDADIRPMIEFLATFKSKEGDTTEGGLFVPLTESQ